MWNISVVAEMLLLLLLHLLLHLCVSAKQSRLEEAVKDDLEEIMCKTEKLDGTENIIEELENKLETKNVEVENLQKRLKEIEVQFENWEGGGRDISTQTHKPSGRPLTQ